MKLSILHTHLVTSTSRAICQHIARCDNVSRSSDVGDKEVATAEAVRDAILQHAAGNRITLKITRDDQPQSLKVRLGQGATGGADGLFGWARRGTMPEIQCAPAWLGVQIVPAESAQERGVMVASVLPGSPAGTAGIKKDDAILRVDNTRVEAAADLQAAIVEFSLSSSSPPSRFPCPRLPSIGLWMFSEDSTQVFGLSGSRRIPLTSNSAGGVRLRNAICSHLLARQSRASVSKESDKYIANLD